jgi:hypothetical protein
MKIYILRPHKSETVPKFLKHLNNCEEGYNYPENKCFVINYGRSYNKAHLNKSICTNKLSQLLTLKECGILVPDVLSFSPKDLLSYPSTTIKKFLTLDKFPIMARKEKHLKGTDIIFLKTRKSLWKRSRRVRTRDFFVKYIPKQAEFRVHVLGNEALNICQKVPSENFSYPHPHVWSSPRGWTLEDYNGEYTGALAELGKKVARILHYDFGAVDIGLGKDGKFYVFEVNSAPRLNRIRRRIYCKYFRQKEKEFSHLSES